MDQDRSNQIFSIQSETEFQKRALETFRFQASENAVYARFVENLRIPIDHVQHTRDIPFLPVEFFKSQVLMCGSKTPQVVFTSSGTTGMVQSRHPVSDITLYEKSFTCGFEHFYGKAEDYVILALLPSYLEREGSSLIYMVDSLIKQSNDESSGYFLYNHAELFDTLQRLQHKKKKVLLIGVTYALLDFAEAYSLNFPDLIVMETGGMKGKRRELIRAELHNILTAAFGVTSIHSEYGMTELLSQAYSSGGGIFRCPPWMKIQIRDMNDPLSQMENGYTGGVNIIDLANRYSCSFIATQDLGKAYSDGSFEILGRFDNSDIRGCNLLVQ